MAKLSASLILYNDAIRLWFSCITGCWINNIAIHSFCLPAQCQMKFIVTCCRKECSYTISTLHYEDPSNLSISDLKKQDFLRIPTRLTWVSSNVRRRQ